MARSNKLQGEIWRQAVAAAGINEAPPAANMLLLPALNQMIEITTSRTTAAEMHPPIVTFVLLYGLGLIRVDTFDQVLVHWLESMK
ncbi:hypothetical protein [Accumulibacter sp.]|uniref:hypothetical protein n=1 Tax=Accumulibacter sp. TaxID=2053492 RepID=UPI0028C46EE9|nr:hypothetical protein [Accumulibacter sp.]